MEAHRAILEDPYTQPVRPTVPPPPAAEEADEAEPPPRTLLRLNNIGATASRDQHLMTRYTVQAPSGPAWSQDSSIPSSYHTVSDTESEPMTPRTRDLNLWILPVRSSSRLQGHLTEEQRALLQQPLRSRTANHSCKITRTNEVLLTQARQSARLHTGDGKSHTRLSVTSG